MQAEAYLKSAAEQLPASGFGAGPAGSFREVSSRLYIGRIPRGTTESAIQLECAKYGIVSSIFYSEEHVESSRGGWASVAFAAADMADSAVRRMRPQLNLFGALEPLEIRHANASDEAMLATALRRE